MGQLEQMLEKMKKLNAIGSALSAERDHSKLLEKILEGARELTGADAGTLYTVGEQGTLRFEILSNQSLQLFLGGAHEYPVPLPEICLYGKGGEPNRATVAAAAVLDNRTINIEDVYRVDGYDFSGTLEFDARTGYLSQSFLTVPISDHCGRVIGGLQLINALDGQGMVRAFSEDMQGLVESLASQAAVAMTNQHLIEKLNGMLESFIAAIAGAIDDKSPHTGDHCRRVPIIATLLAEEVNRIQHGPFADFEFSEEELYELHIAALLHDCGKVVTPVHVVDKATRLERVQDGLLSAAFRFEILRRDLEAKKEHIGEETLQRELSTLCEEWEIIQICNRPETVVEPSMVRVIERASLRQWVDQEGNAHPWLSPEEVECLSVRTGTLTAGERAIIREHASATIKLLKQLVYPDHLKRVPEIAGGHHERIDGTGYPLGLKKEQMSLQARILAIADVFEALTAADRPYKKALPLSEVLEILRKMREESHIDPDLHDVFVGEEVFRRYATCYLEREQVDV